MNDASTPAEAGDLARAEELIAELEQQMPQLQLRNPGAYAIANAWAVRHDAILALTPPPMRADMQRRLSRIGIRWGVAPGPRVTQEFRAIGGVAGLRGATPADEGE